MGEWGILFRLKDDVLAFAIRSLLTLDYLFFERKVGKLCGAEAYDSEKSFKKLFIFTLHNKIYYGIKR